MTLPLADEYAHRYGGRVQGAVRLARDLMGGDPATLKAGYSAENALLAAQEVFELSTDEFLQVGGALMDAAEASP